MPDDLKDYRLLPHERELFDVNGLITVHDVLGQTQLVEATQAIDDIHRRSGDPAKAISTEDFIQTAPIFLEMLSHPKILAKIIGLLGWNISLNYGHASVTTPTLGGSSKGHGITLHQDGGRMGKDVLTWPPPRLAIKAAFFLTDCSQPGRGNFIASPRSMGCREEPSLKEEVLINAGDVLLFDQRLWHGASPNRSSMTRKAVFYAYGYRWLRPRRVMVTDDFIARASPVQKQLLGYNRVEGGPRGPPPLTPPDMLIASGGFLYRFSSSYLLDRLCSPWSLNQASDIPSEA